MPRIVDHTQRRRELADAMKRLIARDGLQAASVRAVAVEAGWSLGTVRHYFATVDDMYYFIVIQLGEAVGERVRTILGADLTPLERAQRLIEELLPIDDDHYAEQRVWLELIVRARFEPALAEVQTVSWEATRQIARLAVASIRHLPLDDPATPFENQFDEHTAVDLHVFVDGLFLQAVVYNTRTPEDLKDDVRTALRRVADPSDE